MNGLNIRQDSCAFDLLSLGALVHRLDPGLVPFRKATECQIHVSGGEFNVAANLSDCFRLRILDDGHPFDARQVPEPDPEQSLQDRQPGGWGISLVRRLARRMDYERRDGANVLTIEIARNS